VDRAVHTITPDDQAIARAYVRLGQARSAFNTEHTAYNHLWVADAEAYLNRLLDARPRDHTRVG
jgi:hypothetical protein